VLRQLLDRQTGWTNRNQAATIPWHMPQSNLRGEAPMLKKVLALLGGSAAGVPSRSEPDPGPAEQALLRQIAERSRTDPLIGAQIGSKEVTQQLIAAMKSDRGVHIESLLCALGSLAGYSCQAALRAQALAQGLAEAGLLTRVETKDGKAYFFGDNLNKSLAESTHSVWGVAGAGAQQAGCANLPDVSEIFKHASLTVGTAAFGKPRVPEGHTPQ